MLSYNPAYWYARPPPPTVLKVKMSKFNGTGKYPIVGALVGADVGLFVGDLVGSFVGDLVGSFVGDWYGLFVGESVGLTVGLGVGA